MQESIQAAALDLLRSGRARTRTTRAGAGTTIALDARRDRARHRGPTGVPPAPARTAPAGRRADDRLLAHGHGHCGCRDRRAAGDDRRNEPAEACVRCPSSSPPRPRSPAVNLVRVRRAERTDPTLPADPPPAAFPPAKALAPRRRRRRRHVRVGARRAGRWPTASPGRGAGPSRQRELWRPLGHAAALAAFAGARLVRSSSARFGSHRARRRRRWRPPSTSRRRTPWCREAPGARSRSRVSLGKVVASSGPSRPRRRSREIFGEPRRVPPIRVYAGLASGPRRGARECASVLDELERTGAFERSWLLVASPTGTGYVNYAAVTAFELLARGDCATVAMQYAARPSVLSLDRVDEGRRQTRLLLDALHERLAALPEAAGPSSCSSARAWVLDEPGPVRRPGHPGLVDAGIDHAIWIGTPHFSKWKEQVLFDERADVDRSLVGVCNDIGEWRALDAGGARPHPLRDDHAPRRRRRAVRARARDPGAGVARRPGRAPGAGVPKSDALDAEHRVLPGARRHEELGHRRARPVRGEGPRLPRRPPAVLPRARFDATDEQLERPRRGSSSESSSAASGSRPTATRARASPRRSSSARAANCRSRASTRTTTGAARPRRRRGGVRRRRGSQHDQLASRGVAVQPASAARGAYPAWPTRARTRRC